MTSPGGRGPLTRGSGATRRSCRATRAARRAVLLPLAMRMAARASGVARDHPQEHGVTHFIAGRDHAGRATTARVRRSTGPTRRRTCCASTSELGVSLVTFRQMVYVEDRDEYVPDDEVPQGLGCCPLSGTEQRRRLNEAGTCRLVHAAGPWRPSCGGPTCRGRGGLHRVLHGPVRRRQVISQHKVSLPRPRQVGPRSSVATAGGVNQAAVPASFSGGAAPCRRWTAPEPPAAPRRRARTRRGPRRRPSAGTSRARRQLGLVLAQQVLRLVGP